MEIKQSNPFTPNDIRLVLTDSQAAQFYADKVKVLEESNRRLEAQIERLYRFLGLREKV